MRNRFQFGWHLLAQASRAVAGGPMAASSGASAPAVETRREGDPPRSGSPFPEGPRNALPAQGRMFRGLGGRWLQIGYVLIDILFICFNAVIVFGIRFLVNRSADLGTTEASESLRHLPVHQYLAFLLLYTTLILLCCQSRDLYRTLRTRTALDESLAVAQGIVLATLLLAAFIYLSGSKEISRLWVGFCGLTNILALAGWRLWKRRVVERRVAQGIGARNVLIIGAGKVGQILARHLEQNKQLGYAFRGFLDQNHTGDARLLGKIEDLAQVARAHFVDEVFITIPSERDLVKRVVVEARSHRLSVKVVPDLYDGLGWNVPLRYVGDFPVMELHGEPIPGLGLIIKRLIDIVASAAGLILLAPVFALVALAIKLDSRGPVSYGSLRVGKKGRKFVCLKFRTMVQNADELKSKLQEQNERQGPFFKIADDPRITRLGRFLRKFSLDELPQLWNVLKGEMSLVGPRPHPLDDYEQYKLEHLRRLDVKPGITGLWQVTARQDPSFEKTLLLDLEYIENWNLLLDLKILLKTVPEVLRASGS